jgi:uncharacterized damage-inducible protein DinB
MPQIPWFERKFDFSFQQNIFPSIIERLSGTSVRLEAKLAAIPAAIQTIQPAGKWSIKEHLGHLSDLEPLWQGRLVDILHGEKYLRSWDLENKQTSNANHNATDTFELWERFHRLRSYTVQRLNTLTEDQIYQSALHPRLKEPLRIMDLFLFVADHDDHHLVKMNEIMNKNL